MRNAQLACARHVPSEIEIEFDIIGHMLATDAKVIVLSIQKRHRLLIKLIILDTVQIKVLWLCHLIGPEF